MANGDNLLEQAKKAFVAGDLAAAERFCQAAVKAAPALAGPWIILTDIALKRQRPDAALAWADKAIALEPRNPFARLVRCSTLLAWARLSDALEAAEAAVEIEDCPPGVLDSFGLAFIQLNRHARARDMFKRAVAADPKNPAFLHNLAAVERTFGALEQSERHFDQVIALNPHFYESYFLRADLRKQTPARNHVAEMEALLAGSVRDPQGEVTVRFALGKEYEDMGEYDRAFRHIKAGADLKRRLMHYRVAANTAIIDRIIRAQTRDVLDSLAAGSDRGGFVDDDPIFVAGLPRSGTTLVERIIAGHSSVFAAGELPALPTELVRAAQIGGMRSNGEWVEQLKSIDMAKLGRAFMRVAREAGVPAGHRFTDKLPANYLFCGAIRLALPNAKIVALRRKPMDSCFALYKMLFNKNINPYSYDLLDLAEYYAAFHRLIEHWQAALPERQFLAVSYEDIVANFEAKSREIMEFLDLPWEDGILRFHESTAPAATASAVQVRQPIYASSVGKWRNYAEQLEPLRARLAELLPGEELG